MPACTGRLKNGAKCSEPLYRCLVCNIIGCKRKEANDCSKQGFNNEICVKCGSTKKELAK